MPRARKSSASRPEAIEAVLVEPPDGESTSHEAPDSAWHVLDALDPAEKAFVLGVMRGMDYPEASRSAGWRTDLSVPRVLGRPLVRHALQTLLPLLPDSRRAARLLAPYVLADSVRSIAAKEPGSREARRDLLAIAGVAGVQRTEHVTASLSEVLAAIEARAGHTESLPAPIPRELGRLASPGTD